ncbi:MAG: hypothetical protein LOX97_07845 [Sphingomonas sp.]|nr:hypothetical protein [Sphingomonas sp.]
MRNLKLKFGNPGEEAFRSAPPDTCRPRRLKVLKFGSSVLRTPGDLPRVVGEIYRLARQGDRVIAVVSALEGQTDALIRACEAASGGIPCSGIAEAVSLGEEQAAALLRVACDRIGLEARVARPEEFGISTGGNVLEATPLEVHGDLPDLFDRSNVLIVPGFVGVHESGCRSLLGRGGTDFSAIFLGGELKADLVRLYKDVDGVFDHDPAGREGTLNRFDEVSWSDCLALARPLLQPRAVEYARWKEQRLAVGGIGSPVPTQVGPQTLPPRAHVRSSSMRLSGATSRIALAGYGTVGQALAERLELEEHFNISSILVRDPGKWRRFPPPAPLTTDIEHFCSIPADVTIDLTSCAEIGRAIACLKLGRGLPVVSANKLAIGQHLSDHSRLCSQSGARLYYSAAVGGSAPVLDTVRVAQWSGEIERVRAVLNGTINFILDLLARGIPYPLALESAQLAGFAEEDPSRDLKGADAELKLRIIAAEILGPDASFQIEVQPLDPKLIEEIAESGERWLQLSSLVRRGSGLEGRVEILPASEVPDFTPPAAERNLVEVTTSEGHEWRASGRGAGGAATAEAVIADLFDLLSHRELQELLHTGPRRAEQELSAPA